MIYNRLARFFRSAQKHLARQVVILGVPPTKRRKHACPQEKLTKREKSWIVYDVGNSAFVLLASTLIPIYFSAIADPASSVVVAWGYATTVASLLLALLMPFLGSIADLEGQQETLARGLDWHGRRAARMHGHSWQRDGVLGDVRGGDHHA